MSIRSTLTEALSRELTLDEMLADPIVRLLMKRDGVSEGELRALVAATPGCRVVDEYYDTGNWCVVAEKVG